MTQGDRGVEQRRFRFDDGYLRLCRTTIGAIEPHQGLDCCPDAWRETSSRIWQELTEVGLRTLIIPYKELPYG